jgi:hypothetical protein
VTIKLYGTWIQIMPDVLNISYKFAAAHCVTKSTVPQPVDPDTLLVYLGKYHLKQWSEGGVQDKQVWVLQTVKYSVGSQCPNY